VPELVESRHRGAFTTSYNQAGAVTGRLSSSGADLHITSPSAPTWVAKSAERSSPAPGHVLMSADYSQGGVAHPGALVRRSGLGGEAFSRGEETFHGAPPPLQFSALRFRRSTSDQRPRWPRP